MKNFIELTLFTCTLFGILLSATFMGSLVVIISGAGIFFVATAIEEFFGFVWKKRSDKDKR